MSKNFRESMHQEPITTTTLDGSSKHVDFKGDPLTPEQLFAMGMKDLEAKILKGTYSRDEACEELGRLIDLYKPQPQISEHTI